VRFFKAGIALRISYQSQDRADVASVVMLPKDCGF